MWDGLKSMGLESYVEKDQDRLITVNTIKVPQGIDWAALIKVRRTPREGGRRRREPGDERAERAM